MFASIAGGASALHFVGLCCLLTLYPTFAARYGDVSFSDSGGLLAFLLEGGVTK